MIVVTWPIPDHESELFGVWEQIQELATKIPNRVLINPPGVSSLQETAAHYSVADYFLMPVSYEPCGLTQQECQRFGTMPIVRNTGGPAHPVEPLASDARRW